MKRRQFIGYIAGAAAWPLAAHGQQAERVRRIGALFGLDEEDTLGQAYLRAFRRGLLEHHWIEGQNVQLDVRWGGDVTDRIRAAATELVRFNPDAILSQSGLALPALLAATRVIPIVFTQITDPLASGFVSSLAHPGGNVTGFASAEFSTAGKMLQLLKEVAPTIERVGVMLNPRQTPQRGMLRAIEAVALSMGLPVSAIELSDPAQLEQSFDALADMPNVGIVVLPNPLTNRFRDRIVAFTSKRRLPAVYRYRYFVTAGGLLSYGERPDDAFRSAASYVDRIIHGEKPGDLPVQQPTAVELVVNLRTAKAIGLTIPESFLLRADEVIE